MHYTNGQMEPHGQSPWYLHEIPSYAKASEGYPPVAKSAEASVLRHMNNSATAYAFIHGKARGLLRRRIKNTSLLPIIRESGVNVRYFPTDNYRDCEKRLLLNFNACFGELPMANLLGGGTDGNR